LKRKISRDSQGNISSVEWGNGRSSPGAWLGFIGTILAAIIGGLFMFLEPNDHIDIYYKVPHPANGKGFDGVISCDIPIKSECKIEAKPERLPVWNFSGELRFYVYAKETEDGFRYWSEITHNGKALDRSDPVSIGKSIAKAKLPWNEKQIIFSISAEIVK
jgi:hypothetical protein